MSVSYHAGVILGVKVAELGFNVEKISTPFEIHDKKGNPTGKFDREILYKMTFQDKEKIVDEMYLEYVEEMISTKKPLVVHNPNYDDLDIDNIIIGIDIVHSGYDDWNLLKEFSLDEFSTVTTEIKNQYGVDVEPKMYFYFLGG
jgi:hypothetical protein